MTGQEKDEIKIRPKDKDPLKEAQGKVAVFTFGRMNPPTIGHLALTEKLVKVARQLRATPLIYLSHSQDSKKNPLSYDEKLKLAKAAFGPRLVVKSRSRTIIQIMKELQRSYTDVVLVVGSDRVAEFKKLLETYNGRDYKFESIKVVSAGTRDPDDAGVRGMSASKMRDMAARKDLRGFERGLPPSIKSMADIIMGMIRAGMKLQEELDAEGLGPIDLDEARKPLTLLQRRRRGILMKRYRNKIRIARARVARRMADKGRLQIRSRRAARRILRQRLAGPKGKSYNSLSPSEKMIIDKRVSQRSHIIGKIARRLLPRVKRAEMERLRRLRGGAAKKKTPMRKAGRSAASESINLNIKFENYIAEQYGWQVDIKQSQDLNTIIESFLDKIVDDRISLTEKAEANLIKKSEKNDIPLTELKLAYEEGYNNPTGQQSPEQSGFLMVNSYIQENTKATDAKQEKELKSIAIRHARQDAAAKVKEIRAKKANEEFNAMLKELSTDTLVSYISKASDARGHKGMHPKKVDKRYDGVAKAGKKLDKRLSGESSEVSGNGFEVDNTFIKKRGAQLTPKEKARANAQFKQKARDEIKRRTAEKRSQKEDVERRADFRMTKKKMPDGKIKFVKAPKKEVEIGKGKYESVNEQFELLSELYFRVEVEGLPVFYIQQSSPSQIKVGLRKILKKADMIKSVERVSPAAVKQAYRERAKGQVADPDPEKTPSEASMKSKQFEAKDSDIVTRGPEHKALKAKKDIEHGVVDKGGPVDKKKIKKGLKKANDHLDGPNWWPGGTGAFGAGYNEETMPEVFFERPLTPGEEKKKEEIVKAMKRKNQPLPDSAKYAIATAVAKKVAEALEIGTDAIAKKYRQDTPGQTPSKDPQVIDGTPKKDGKISKPEFLKMSEDINAAFEFQLMTEDDSDPLEDPEYAEYEGRKVPLERPMVEMDEEDEGGEKKQEIGKPKRGGPKKFYVYVRKPDGGVKKVTFGDTSGLSVKMNNPEARKSFAARHKCSTQTDKTSAAYWACRLPRYAKQLGMSGGGSFFW